MKMTRFLDWKINRELGVAFWKKMAFASLLFVIVIAYATWPVISAPNSTYSATVDGLGHLTRIKYSAKQISYIVLTYLSGSQFRNGFIEQSFFITYSNPI